MTPQSSDSLADDGWQGANAELSPASASTLTLHVPFRIVKRGGRKEMFLPPDQPPQRKMDNTLVKGLARAFRWRRMLESGEFVTIAELAKHERIAAPFLTRTMRLAHLAHLAPDLVEAILDGRQSRALSLEMLRDPFPSDWACQRKWLRDQAL